MATGERLSNPGAKPPPTGTTLFYYGFKPTNRRAVDFVKCADPNCKERGPHCHPVF